jgi:hypothetical protein
MTPGERLAPRDAVLGIWAGPWAICFAVTSRNHTTIFNFVVGGVIYQIYSEATGAGQDVLCMHRRR